MKLFIKKFFEKIKNGNLIVHLSMLAVFVAFLFLPFENVVNAKNEYDYSANTTKFFTYFYKNIEYYLKYLDKKYIYDMFLYFFTPLIVSLFWIVFIFLCKKIKVLAIIIPCFPLILIFDFISYFLSIEYVNGCKQVFQIGFYLYLIYAIVCISFYLYLLYEHYTKTHKTKSQRIAELESQVAELKSNSNKTEK